MEKTRILLVDDEPEFRTSTTRVLERRGFGVRTAADGAQALARIEEEVPDLVLLDLRMEGMDGIATLRELRDRHPRLPVIILTGHGDLPSAMAGIRLEIVDFLQKPVDIEALTRKIRSVLNRETQAPLRERTVTELMVPVSSYRSVSVDATVKDALRALRETYRASVASRITEVGHRSILVMDRFNRLHGVLRMLDVLEMIEPAFLRDSPYSAGYTGMFLARCKTFGDRPIGEYLDPDDVVSITEGTPLMEALAVMTRHRVINLPVMGEGKVLGILRDRDLFLEILTLVLGE